ncbi:Ig-like domain-containing protein, partial [Klebsiella pneumoniae]|nr:Ig-like domain-containing protein [Klebsiella pneumoniae]
MSPASASVRVGATTTLTKTIAPSTADEKGGTWTSSNPAIATVDAN